MRKQVVSFIIARSLQPETAKVCIKIGDVRNRSQAEPHRLYSQILPLRLCEIPNICSCNKTYDQHYPGVKSLRANLRGSAFVRSALVLILAFARVRCAADFPKAQMMLAEVFVAIPAI